MAVVWKCDRCDRELKVVPGLSPLVEYSITAKGQTYEFCSPTCLKNWAINQFSP